MPRLHILPLVLLSLLFASGTNARAGEGPRRVGTVSVRDESFVRLDAAALAGLGAKDPERVGITHRGRPVSATSDETGVVFLAQGHQTGTSAWGVYEIHLHAGPAPRWVPTAAALVPMPPLPPWSRRVVSADRVHGTIEAARPEVYAHPHLPTWFLAVIRPAQATVVDLDPQGAAKGEAQTLTARIYATRIGTVALRATWGEQDLGVVTGPTAAGGADFTWKVPADAVPEEGTALVVADVSPPPPPPMEQDWSDGRGTLFLDSLTLEGPVEARIDNALRTFDSRLGDIRLALASEEAPIHLAVLTRDGPAVADEWKWGRDDAGRVEVWGSSLSDCRVFASTRTVTGKPMPAGRRADPLGLAGDARHVVIAVPALAAEATRLATHRTQHGLPSAVVRVDAIYDAYGFGDPSWGAIRAFLVDLMARPGAPLEYVVLAGDATLDRPDMAPFATIPAPMARTMYNGATAADRLYGLPPGGSPIGGAEIGRLPFREAAELEAYVSRLIRYETEPPASPTRRLLRFVTNESRFGAFIDRMLEMMFGTIVANHVPPAYDIEVTFASKASPYLWPPLEMNDHVIQGFNDGCLFFTYVGHGSGRSFDQLRIGAEAFPVLHVDDAGQITCKGTPPIVFVLACTTAIFDHPGYEGIGETLLARPDGPLAYWGATRVCHPAANTLLGRAITQHIARREGDRSLGRILGGARDDVLDPPASDGMRNLINLAINNLAKGADPERLAVEGTWMYALLGDPALKVAFPLADLAVAATVNDKDAVEVTIEAPLPNGTEIHVSLEAPRNAPWQKPEKVADPLDPALAEQIRENHAKVNDLAYVRATVTLQGGQATWEAKLPEGIRERTKSGRKLVVKAWTIHAGDVHQGAVRLKVPERRNAPEKAPAD